MYAKASLSMFDVQVRWSEAFPKRWEPTIDMAACDRERIAWLKRDGRQGMKDYIPGTEIWLPGPDSNQRPDG
jgi:hypothetical protein